MKCNATLPQVKFEEVEVTPKGQEQKSMHYVGRQVWQGSSLNLETILSCFNDYEVNEIIELDKKKW
ncbi:hypothetical protein [Lacihabitans lacunae]|jgi:hypothetical protein|uniref:Uncharacterized protein n=1 Tax=Lacihabitans lacunae TaxID=1028214 RepID=A0ABV7Z461_9BACT